tara:strand:+ start:29 stop:520 length:492 start_codon:yes stop_codon:yes gene_type:complete
MSNFSSNKKISLIAGGALAISLFLPWISFMIFSESLIGIPGLIGTLQDLSGAFGGEESLDLTFAQNIAIYIGYAYLIFAGAGLYLNYTGDIKKSKLFYYLIPVYFILVVILNIADLDIPDMPSDSFDFNVFDFLGIGFYMFVISYVVVLIKLKPDDEADALIV